MVHSFHGKIRGQGTCLKCSIDAPEAAVPVARASERSCIIPPSESPIQEHKLGLPQSVMRRSFLPYFLALLFMLLAGVWSAQTGLITDGRSGDGMDYYMPGRAFTASALRAGYLPEWNPYVYTGYAHIGDIQNGFFYPPNLIFYLLFSGTTAYTLSIVFHLFLTAFFTSRFLGLFVRSSYARWIGAATFTLCGFLACNAMSVTIPDSAVWIPAFFWCVEKWIRTQRWRYCAWGGLCIALQLFAGWPQMVLLTVIYLGVYLLFALPGQSKPIRILTGLAVAGVIAVGLGIPQLVATLQLKNESIIQHLSFIEFSFGSVAPQLTLLLSFPFLAGAGFSGVLWHKVATTPNQWPGERLLCWHSAAEWPRRRFFCGDARGMSASPVARLCCRCCSPGQVTLRWARCSTGYRFTTSFTTTVSILSSSPFLSGFSPPVPQTKLVLHI